MRYRKILAGGVVASFLAVLPALAANNQPIQGGVRGVATSDIFACGSLAAPTPDTCTLHDEYWSTDGPGSALINRDTDGVPHFIPRAGKRGHYRGKATNLANYFIIDPVTGIPSEVPFDASWYHQWFGEIDGDTGDHIGYYAAQSQKVSRFERGNALAFDCAGSPPIACYTPLGGPLSPAPSHPVCREDPAGGCPAGAEELPLGGLSPIPIPRAVLDSINLTVNLNWDKATGTTQKDGIGNPIRGYRVLVAQDLNPDGACPAATTLEYEKVFDIEDVDTTLHEVGVSELDPLAEGYYFAIQLLYQSTPDPLDAFDRRSGRTLPNGVRVRGLSANSNLVIRPVVQNFQGVTGTGNRAEITWDSDPGCGVFPIDFVVQAVKDPTGLADPVPSQHATQTFVVPYVSGQTSYGITDTRAGRSESKINIYVITARFADSTEIVFDSIVVRHKDK